MAWIKMRSDLYDDPAVVEIMAITGLDEFGVVGRLHAIWTWADGASRDGHVRSVTPSSLVLFLERKIACAGFVAAMCQVGWMRIGSDRITFPKFERHMSKSAKNRALATERQSRKRRDDVSRTQRDKSVTREEKSREEKNRTPSLRSGVARWRKAPRDFALTDELVEYGVGKGLTEAEVRDEFEGFMLHEFDPPRTDPSDTFKNWLRRGARRGPPARGPSGGGTAAQRSISNAEEFGREAGVL